VDELKEIFWGAVLGIVCTLPLAVAAHGQTYVVAFHAPGCVPCAEMVPVEKALCEEGYTIKTIDITEHPSWKRYCRVTRVPTYAVLVSCGDGDYDTGCRIIGKCTKAQLEALCRMPYLETAADITRRTLRSVAMVIGGGL
jgi:hypothetical protein